MYVQENTALMLAVQAKHIAIVKLLLKHHADVNIHGYGVTSFLQPFARWLIRLSKA